MADNAPRSENTPRRRSVRVTPRLLLAGGLVLLLFCGVCGYRFWRLSDPNVQITVGPETTVFTEPLNEHGDIDYGAAINRQLSTDVTVENNSVVLLARAFGPALVLEEDRAEYFRLLGIPEPPEAGSYFVNEEEYAGTLASENNQDVDELLATLSDQREQAQSRLWTRNEFPDLAALIDANDGAFSIVTEASRRSRYYSPLIISPEYPVVTSRLNPIEFQLREAVRLLAARAMLRLADRILDGAWEDLLSCHRLSRLVGEVPFFFESAMSMSLQAHATEASAQFLTSDEVTAVRLRRCFNDLKRLPPLLDPPTVIDQGERVDAVGNVILAIRNGESGLTHLFDQGIPGIPDSDVDNQNPSLLAAFDWNVVLQSLNQEYDNYVTAMRLESFASRSDELDRQFADLPSIMGMLTIQMYVAQSLAGEREEASRAIGRALAKRAFPTVMIHINGTRSVARERLLLIAFALTIHDREQGEYPATLDDLTPDPLDAIPLDPFTDQTFVYEPTDHGFRIYSLGDNMTDDGGATYDSEPEGDDIVIEVRSE